MERGCAPGHPVPEPIRQWSPFFTGVDTRVIRSALGVPGRATVWFRLERALVEGEENSPLVQAVSAADLTIHFWRRPRGSWILVDALTGSRLPATYPARVHVEAR